MQLLDSFHKLHSTRAWNSIDSSGGGDGSGSLGYRPILHHGLKHLRLHLWVLHLSWLPLDLLGGDWCRGDYDGPGASMELRLARNWDDDLLPRDDVHWGILGVIRHSCNSCSSLRLAVDVSFTLIKKEDGIS